VGKKGKGKEGRGKLKEERDRRVRRKHPLK